MSAPERIVAFTHGHWEAWGEALVCDGEPTYTRDDIVQALLAAKMKEVVALCQQVAAGYAAGGDHAISTGILLTSGNIQSLITPGMAQALADRDERVKREERERAAWPDFIAPAMYESPAPGWTDPRLPEFRLIWKVARECGYSIGLHGSMKRDCDLIAAPWTDEAINAFDLIERLCEALNAKPVGKIAGKPHGRLGWNLQIDGWFKAIDISVMPRACDQSSAIRADGGK